MKNVIAYTRVSTGGQLGEDKYGMDVQREKIEKYCASHDMNIVRWVADEGESGAKYRPGFDSIIYGDVTNPPYEAVVVARSDRVARNVSIYFYYSGELLRKNIELISVEEDFGENEIFADVLRAFTLTCARMEREAITKRTSGGRAAKAAQGGYAGGSAPMGYQALGGSLIIEEQEAKLVRRIFELKDEHDMTLRAISGEVNSEGFTGRNGKPLSYGVVRNVLNNRKTYEGWYRYGKSGEWVKGQHEPILKPTTPDSEK